MEKDGEGRRRMENDWKSITIQYTQIYVHLIFYPPRYLVPLFPLLSLHPGILRGGNLCASYYTHIEGNLCTSYLHDGRTVRPAAGEAEAGKGEAHGDDGERFGVGGGEEGDTDHHPAPGEGKHGGEAAGAVEQEAGEGGEEEHEADHDRAAERHGAAPYVELGGHRYDVHLWGGTWSGGGTCGCC